MTESLYQLIESGRGVPIKAWTRGVLLEPEAGQQLRNVASLPIVYKWVAAMLDVHWGIGATIGSLIPTKGVECRKDKDVINETPGAYKPIHAVMQAQQDLVDIVDTLRQVVCVKG